MRDKRENKLVKLSLGARSLLPHQQIHTTISLSYFADTETPSRWEKLTINDGMLPPNTQTPDLSGLKVDNADSYLPHLKPIRRMTTSWSHRLWTITIKHLTVFPTLGHVVLRALASKRGMFINMACVNFLSPEPTNHLQNVDRYLNQGSRWTSPVT